MELFKEIHYVLADIVHPYDITEVYIVSLTAFLLISLVMAFVINALNTQTRLIAAFAILLMFNAIPAIFKPIFIPLTLITLVFLTVLKKLKKRKLRAKLYADNVILE